MTATSGRETMGAPASPMAVQLAAPATSLGREVIASHPYGISALVLRRLPNYSQPKSLKCCARQQAMQSLSHSQIADRTQPKLRWTSNEGTMKISEDKF